ncbi:hypothetical protein KY349_05235 [Candidatus Woesearchaeota archaeon]|nr:hypothetical protein [Candidatus Woesearchaeota archaeon]
MKKIVILLIGLLVLANMSFAAEQAQEVEEEGFFSKLFSFFKPKQVSPDSARVLTSSADEESTDKPVPMQDIDYGNHVEYDLDEIPIESDSVEGYEGVVEAVDTIAVRPMPMPEPMPPIEEDHEIRSCEAVICYNKWQQELFCPSSYRNCARKYNNCRTVSCNPPRPQQYDCPSCVSCPEPVPVCREKVHLCIQMEPAEDGTDIASYNEVKCEGTYDDCVEKYRKCKCGLPEPQPQPICREKQHTCKKWVYSTTETSEEDTATSTALAHIAYVTCEGTFEQCEEGHISCACGLIKEVPVAYTTASSAE